MQNFYFQTKKFYFNSDKLKEKTATYSLDNWSGAGEYTININMNSIKNNLLKAETDISYNITYQCPSTVTCQITKTSGVIYGSVNNDSFNIVVTPNTTFHDGDTILIYVSATSPSPYEKTISARFILKVGKIGLSYEITDEEKSPYLEFRITNTIDYYLVEEAFDNYNIGDRIEYEGVKAEIQTDNDVLLKEASSKFKACLNGGVRDKGKTTEEACTGAGGTWTAINETYFTPVTVDYSTVQNFDESVQVFGGLTQGITKIRVYMWVEGQDVDCENGASGGNINYDLQFSINA